MMKCFVERNEEEKSKQSTEVDKCQTDVNGFEYENTDDEAFKDYDDNDEGNWDSWESADLINNDEIIQCFPAPRSWNAIFPPPKSNSVDSISNAATNNSTSRAVNATKNSKLDEKSNNNVNVNVDSRKYDYNVVFGPGYEIIYRENQLNVSNKWLSVISFARVDKIVCGYFRYYQSNPTDISQIVIKYLIDKNDLISVIQTCYNKCNPHSKLFLLNMPISYDDESIKRNKRITVRLELAKGIQRPKDIITDNLAYRFECGLLEFKYRG